MKTLRDSSEIKEAARIISELAANSAVTSPSKIDPQWPKIPLAAPMHISLGPDQGTGQSMAGFSLSQEEVEPEIVYRGDQLEEALVAMCKRGGFNGAVVADDNGFPLASYNSPVGDEVVAAFTSVLGMALEEAGDLLDQHEANYITMDINYTEKAALRRFFIKDIPYSMMIICPQEVDEKSEVELSIDQIIKILK
jgi:hypothetical protein